MMLQSRLEHMRMSEGAMAKLGGTAQMHLPEPQEQFMSEFIASRVRCTQAKRILVKIGTRVATRSLDERLAIGRLGAIAEEIQQLLMEKKQVIMVISGANTVGRQKLRYQQILHSSPLGYQQLSRTALSPAACVSAGQSGVMALWEKYFSMLGVGCSQLLISHDDLQHANSCENIKISLEALLEMGVVPIINDNPSAHDMPEDSGMLIDNDDLAAQVSAHLAVDLSLFLTNVDGVPWDSTALCHRDSACAPLVSSPSLFPSSRQNSNASLECTALQHPSIISTYCPQMHGSAEEIMHSKGDASSPAVARTAWGPEHTCSDDSTRSLRSKVAAAWSVAESGSIAVVLNGLHPSNIHRVVVGEKVGTLFCKQSALDMCMRGLHGVPSALLDTGTDKTDEHGVLSPCSHSSVSQKQVHKVQSMQDLAEEAAAASKHLASLTADARSCILSDLAAALDHHKEDLILANHVDIANMRAHGSSLPEVTAQRMMLEERHIERLVEGIRHIAGSEDPVDKILSRCKVAEGLILDKVSVPLGVILAIVEARPDVVPQLAALAVRSGNGLLIKASDELHNTTLLLQSIICTTLSAHGCGSLISLIHAREDVEDVLEMDGSVDLIIVRGSSTLVKSIQNRTKTPVLGHPDGVCCIYVDQSVDMEMACEVCVDSKVDYPAACNSLERILVHKKHRESGGLFMLLSAFRRVGVEVFGGSKSVQDFLDVPPPPSDTVEFHDLKLVLEVVADFEEAVEYIHEHGSGHTDAICTSDEKVAESFLRVVDSACVFANCSTRFSDGRRFGFGGECGISTSRLHARGPVGADGLMMEKYLLRGSGQVVAHDTGVKYMHKFIPA